MPTAAKRPVARQKTTAGGKPIRRTRRKANSHLPTYALPPVPVERQNNPAFRAGAAKHPMLAAIQDEGAKAWRAYFADRRKTIVGKGVPLIEDAAILVAGFEAYGEFLDRNPYITGRPTTDGDEYLQAFRCAPTIQGLCSFLGISTESWRNWKSPASVSYQEHLADTITMIEDTMHAAGAQLAASRELDPAFMARLLKLGDKLETTNTNFGVSADVGAAVLDRLRTRLASDGPPEEESAE